MIRRSFLKALVALPAAMLGVGARSKALYPVWLGPPKPPSADQLAKFHHPPGAILKWNPLLPPATYAEKRRSELALKKLLPGVWWI